ncbi:carboxypeptidase-like regulatory domain-containing protein [Candidatus Hydrogenedentota bacterium]
MKRGFIVFSVILAALVAFKLGEFFVSGVRERLTFQVGTGMPAREEAGFKRMVRKPREGQDVEAGASFRREETPETAATAVEGIIPTEEETIPTDSITVSGVVVDKQDRPVFGATIFYGDKTDAPEAVTAPDGSFKLQLVPPTDKSIRATHPDFLHGESTFLSAPVKIALSQGGTVEGHVSFNGAPLPGESVAVHPLAREPFKTKTDQSGYYRIGKVSTGLSGLYIQYASAQRNIETYIQLSEGEVERLDFDFPGLTASLEGEVTIDGDAPSSLFVALNIEGENDARELFRPVVTDNTYSFPSLPAGKAGMLISTSDTQGGKYSQLISFTIADDDAAMHNVNFSSKTVLAGRLFSPAGFDTKDGTILVLVGEVLLEELSLEALVQFAHLSAAEQAIDATTDSFRFVGLTPGTYTIIALSSPDGIMGKEYAENFDERLNRSLFAAVIVDVKENEIAEVDLLLE